MADPYDDFSDRDPYADFSDATPERTSQAQGFAKGFLTPFARLNAGVEKAQDRLYDTVTGGKKPLGDMFRPSNVNAFTTIGGKSATDSENVLRNAFAKREADGVRSGGGGELVGQLAASVPIAFATKNPFVGGAATGAFLSKAENPVDLAIDTVAGAVLGKVGDKVVGGVANVLKPVLSDGVEALSKAGVRLTPGQMAGGKALAREDKLMSQPVVGEMVAKGRIAANDQFNLATIGRALSPIGAKPPAGLKPGHEAVEWAQGAVDDVYERIVPQLTARIDQRLGPGLRRIAKDVQSLPAKEQEAFVTLVKNTFGETGELTGRQVKAAQSTLSRLGSSFSKSNDAYQQQLGKAVSGFKREFDHLLERQNPAVEPQLKAVNRAFRGLALVEDAASRVDDGVFTPRTLTGAVRRSDQTRRKAATAGGNAFMQDWSKAASEVLPSQVPNTGTADRLLAHPLGSIVGGVNALGYQARNMFAPLALAPRPAAVGRAADGLRSIKPQVGSLTPAGRKYERK